MARYIVLVAFFAIIAGVYQLYIEYLLATFGRGRVIESIGNKDCTAVLLVPSGTKLHTLIGRMTLGSHLHQSSCEATLIIVMGVSGAGKSTLGVALSQALGFPFIDGDDLHPQGNIEKMTAGQPLTDADRAPWLERIRTTARHMLSEQQASVNPTDRLGIVVACSALKKRYRDILRWRGHVESETDTSPKQLYGSQSYTISTYFVFVSGTREVLLKRMEDRRGHFMGSNMLDSQLDALESPEGEENTLVVSAEDSTTEQVRKIIAGMTIPKA